MPTPMSAADANSILAKSTKGGTTGKRKAKSIDRTYHSWFHDTGLQKLATCSNPNCSAPTADEVAGATGPYRMTALVDNLIMCRYCFLAGYGRSPESSLTDPPICDTT